MYTILFYQMKLAEQRIKIKYHLNVSQNKKYCITLIKKEDNRYTTEEKRQNSNLKLISDVHVPCTMHPLIINTISIDSVCVQQQNNLTQRLDD